MIAAERETRREVGDASRCNEVSEQVNGGAREAGERGGKLTKSLVGPEQPFTLGKRDGLNAKRGGGRENMGKGSHRQWNEKRERGWCASDKMQLAWKKTATTQDANLTVPLSTGANQRSG